MVSLCALLFTGLGAGSLRPLCEASVHSQPGAPAGPGRPEAGPEAGPATALPSCCGCQRVGDTQRQGAAGQGTLVT